MVLAIPPILRKTRAPYAQSFDGLFLQEQPDILQEVIQFVAGLYTRSLHLFFYSPILENTCSEVGLEPSVPFLHQVPSLQEGMRGRDKLLA